MIRCSLAFLLLSSATSALFASPFRFDDLPESTRMCLHVDLDVIQQIDWLRCQQQALLDDSELGRFLEKLPGELEFLKRMRVHDLTVFSSDMGDDSETVVQIRADLDVGKLTELLTLEEEHGVVSHAGCAIHHLKVDKNRWGDRLPFLSVSENPPDSGCLYVAMPQAGLFLFSTSLHALTRSLDVRDGRADSLPAESLSNSSADLPGHTLFRYHCLAAEPSTDDTAPAAPRVVHCVGKVDQKLHLLVTLDMTSKSIANMMLQYLEPSTLKAFIASVAPPKNAQADAESTADSPEQLADEGEDGAPEKKNSLTLGLKFSGHSMQDVDEAVRCILSSLRVSCDESRVHFRWSSYAHLEYAYKERDGKHDLQLLVDVSSERPQATASKPTAKTTR